MNARRSRILVALVLGTLSVFVAARGLAGDSAAPTPAGEVTFREGRALRVSPQGKKKALKKGSKVFPGDRVKTIGRSKLEIRLGDGSVIRLGPKSEATIAEASFADGTRKVSVGLKLGKAWTKVTKAFGADAKYEIRTDNAVAGVRGTTFRVNANKDHSTLVRVYAGAVAVAGVHPTYQTHAAGEKREQVSGPKEVSKAEWEKLVSAMMSIKIGANGLPSEPVAFSADEEKHSEEAAWVAWNEERDAKLE